MILALRDDFKSSGHYKRVYRKDSFDDWSLAIETLTAWDVLLPQAAADFRELMKKRHEAIHFRPETDQNAKGLALKAIKCLQNIIGEQFSGFGPQPWFITNIPGEIYIRKEWESNPFVRTVYLNNGVHVGPKHNIEAIHPRIIINDPDHSKSGPDVSDEEFAIYRRSFNDGGQKG